MQLPGFVWLKEIRAHVAQTDPAMTSGLSFIAKQCNTKTQQELTVLSNKTLAVRFFGFLLDS